MWRQLAIPFAAALCVAGQARAQSSDPNHLAIDGSVTTTYDTDVPHTDAESARLRGLQLADVLVQPSVSVDLQKTLGQQSLFLRGNAGYNFYDRDSVLNSEQIAIGGGANLRAGACQATVSDQYNRFADNLQEGIDVQIVKNLQTIDTVSLSLGCTRTIGFTPTGSVSSAWADNSSPVLTGTNYHSTSSQVGVAYRHPLLGYLSLYGTYSATDYPSHGTAAAPNPNNSYDQYGGGIHYERNIGIKLTGSADLSYVTVDQQGIGGGGYNGISYGLDLNAHITGRLSGTLHAGRSVKPSVQVSSSFAIADSYALNLSYQLSQHITFSAGAQRTINNNQGVGPNAAALIVVPRTTVSDVYGQGTIDFARRFSLTLAVRGETSTSNFAILDYNSAQVSLTLKGKL